MVRGVSNEVGKKGGGKQLGQLQAGGRVESHTSLLDWSGLVLLLSLVASSTDFVCGVCQSLITPLHLEAHANAGFAICH